MVAYICTQPFRGRRTGWFIKSGPCSDGTTLDLMLNMLPTLGNGSMGTPWKSVSSSTSSILCHNWRKYCLDLLPRFLNASCPSHYTTPLKIHMGLFSTFLTCLVWLRSWSLNIWQNFPQQCRNFSSNFPIFVLLSKCIQHQYWHAECTCIFDFFSIHPFKWHRHRDSPETQPWKPFSYWISPPFYIFDPTFSPNTNIIFPPMPHANIPTRNVADTRNRPLCAKEHNWRLPIVIGLQFVETDLLWCFCPTNPN